MTKKPDIDELKETARLLRCDIIEMLAKAGSGHPGGSLSSVEIVTTLFFHVLRIRPKEPQWPDRDRFHLSKGHCCPAVYAALARRGFFPRKDLWTLRQFGSILQGHPDCKRTPGIEVSSGSLGHGLAIGCGMAVASRLDKRDSRVYVLMGDGEIQEGSVWEAAMFAAHYKLDNLCAVLDYNGMQIDGWVKDVMALEPLREKWEGFGWRVLHVNGHHIGELVHAFDSFKDKEKKGKPTIIIASTVKGKGVSFMENVVDFHGRAPTKEQAERALKELENGIA
ncbi:MAG: transketolase [Candidatus Omnitrophica bacterium]|nr:transketolase [Candidatus Omnitrophota bacterium]